MDQTCTPMFDILVMSNSLCLNFDNWFNNNYKNEIDNNNLFKYIISKYPFIDTRSAYSIVMACLLYLYSYNSIYPSS